MSPRVALTCLGMLTAAGATPGTVCGSDLEGKILIDGSSTVFPISAAVAEEFEAEHPDVHVPVSFSGTGGGFKRFNIGEIDISNASRPIKAMEYALAKKNGIQFIEVPVAYDGLTIVANKNNDWTTELTLEQIRKIFLEGGRARSWKDVNPAWPEVAIKIYAPGTDSGTFDYFQEVVAGKKDKETGKHKYGEIRKDMSVSEDDNVLVRGVMGERGAIGFFGCAYFFENQENLRAVPVVNPQGVAIAPTTETIENGNYAPFSRPLFIYVNAKSLRKPEVQTFIEFYFDVGPDLAQDVGYVRLPDEVYEAAQHNIRYRRAGTQFLDDEGEKVHGPVTEVYQKLDAD